MSSMEKAQTDINGLIFTILTAASKPGGTPSGVAYAQLMGMVDADVWLKVVHFLKENKMITVTNHVMEATEKGRNLQSRMEKILAEAVEAAKAKVSA